MATPHGEDLKQGNSRDSDWEDDAREWRLEMKKSEDAFGFPY